MLSLSGVGTEHIRQVSRDLRPCMPPGRQLGDVKKAPDGADALVILDEFTSHIERSPEDPTIAIAVYPKNRLQRCRGRTNTRVYLGTPFYPMHRELPIGL